MSIYIIYIISLVVDMNFSRSTPLTVVLRGFPLFPKGCRGAGWVCVCVCGGGGGTRRWSGGFPE